MWRAKMEKRGNIDPEITPIVEEIPEGEKQASVDELAECPAKRLAEVLATHVEWAWNGVS
jgi:hypothetical protein